jgi:hypothetical protein
VPSATDWADAAGTINYEIVTRIGRRVPRRYRNPAADVAGDAAAGNLAGGELPVTGGQR